MWPPDDDSAKAPASTPSCSRAGRLALLLIALQVMFTLLTYPLLPANIPHTNLAGQVDGSSPKWLGAIILPATSICLYLLLHGVFSSTIKRKNERATKKLLDSLVVALLIFLLILQVAMIASESGLPVNPLPIIGISTSALFIFLGNFMGKLPYKSGAGIKTRWSFASEIVWERTHRLTGWLWVGGGVLGIPLSFVPYAGIFIVSGIILVISFVPVLISYMFYRHIVGANKKPLL
jgi:uncharacterized membrane protein